MSQASTLITLVALSLAGTHAAVAQENPPSSRWVEIGKPHLAKRADTYVLVHAITSTASRDRFWALVEVNAPDGSRMCEWLKTLEPRQAYRFECPLQEAAAQKYASRVRVYSDAKLEDRELLYEPVLDVTPQRLGAAEDAPAGAATVPDGVFEAIDAPLPITFKPTWYRRLDRGFAMRAYEHSGDFTVTPDELMFVNGKTTVRIPHTKVLSVRWEPVPNDIANHWLVVRFTNDAGQADGVAFRDGGRMGTRGNTGPIYQAVRRAVEK
jgi:hypothetical protein